MTNFSILKNRNREIENIEKSSIFKSKIEDLRPKTSFFLIFFLKALIPVETLPFSDSIDLHLIWSLVKDHVFFVGLSSQMYFFIIISLNNIVVKNSCVLIIFISYFSFFRKSGDKRIGSRFLNSYFWKLRNYNI